MNQTPRHRTLTSRLILVAVAACGAVAGGLLGCAYALVQAGNSLGRTSAAAIALENAALAEAHTTLRAMQNSHFGTCSDAEIANFRSLVSLSEFLKDAGRMRGGRIECSATAGRPDRAANGSIAPFKPLFRLGEGSFAYRVLGPAHIPGLSRMALRAGSAYVVFNLELPPVPASIPADLTITMNTGAAPTVTEDPVPMTTEGSGIVGRTLYATRCSNSGFSCVTASIAVSGALDGESDVLPLFTTTGGMAAIFLWMGFPFLDIRNRDLSRQLLWALEHDQLQVHYQPIVNLETRQIVGAEALARWTNRDGKAVDPEVFVKTAEDHGFIGLITKAVLKRVLRDFAPTLQKYPGFRISINVGAPDLVEPEFLPMLENALRKAKVRPESLVVEITERSASNGPVAKHTISTLRRLGHSIHIDDFGSGFSNLDKLLYLYADTIKIDKAFTKTIGTESVAAVILPHIMTIAKSLNLEVIVEGVEIPYQADYFLPGRQRIYGQGWLFGRPMTAEALLSRLTTGMAAPAPPDRYGVLNAMPASLSVESSLPA